MLNNIKGRSTTLQLLNLLDLWTNSLEDGGQIDVIYTDFEKAFDKVPRKRLLSKLQSYGISQELLNWTEGFLLQRQQQVRVNSKYSDFDDLDDPELTLNGYYALFCITHVFRNPPHKCE